MIHDFAKSPRSYRLTPQVKSPAPARPRKLPKIRWLMLLVIVVMVAAWKARSPESAADAEFVPGQTESSEYEAALEQQAREQAALSQQQASAQRLAAIAEQKKQVAQLQEKLRNSTHSEPEFGFYDSLAGSSWSVPVQRGIYVTEEDRKRASQRYMLQAASVRELAEAQRIVQRLRQLGLQTFYSEGSGGWYRINVGPFDNVSKMNKAEDILVSLRMMPLKRRL